MSFIDNLRMTGMFKPGAGMQPPDMSHDGMGGFDFGSLINTMLQEKEKDRNLQLKLASMHSNPSGGNLAKIGAGMRPDQQQPKEPMNWVYKDNGLTDFQRESLRLRDKEIGSKDTIAGMKNDISSKRANVYEFKAKNPGMKFIPTKGGNVVGFNPLTGESIDTGIDSGSLSDEEKIHLTGDQTMKEIGARGTIQKDLQNTRGTQALAQIGARTAGQKEVKETASPSKPMLPTQERVSQNNAARELLNSKPELAPFIKMDESGNFTIEKPSKNFFGQESGPSLGQFKQINDAIYGSSDKTGILTNSELGPKKTDEKKPAKSKYNVTIE